MKVFVINLDRSTDRLAFFVNQARRLELPFERLAAVDGKRLTDEELVSYTSNPFEFQPISRFEVACFLSHRNSWEQVIRRKLSCAVVFEDDVVLSHDIRKAFEGIDSSRIPFDVVKIETTLRKVVCKREADSLDSGHRLQQLMTWHGGTAGYVVSYEGARKLLDATSLLADQVDQVIFNPFSRVSSSLKILQCVPALCVQQDLQHRGSPLTFQSTIERNKTRRRLFRHGPVIDTLRMLKKQRERLRRQGLSLLPRYQEFVVPFGGESASHQSEVVSAA